MNKNIMKKVLILICIFLLIQVFLYLFKTKHEVNYEIIVNNQKANIKEIYSNKRYNFLINIGKEKYSFSIPDTYKKSKKILKKIEYYKTGDVSCIYPVVNDANILCIKDNTLYSYEYYKDLLKDFKNDINKKYKLEEIESEAKTLGTLNIKYIPEDTYIYLYKYNGFYSINNKELNQINIFDNDTYLNKLGANIGKYYLIPDYNEKYEYTKFYIYNMTNNKRKVIKLKDKISSNSYINGIVDDKLYIFDREELKQYEINFKRRKIKEVGNKSSGGKYYSSSFKNRNIYDFKDELKFVYTVDTDIKADYIYKYKDEVYYYRNNTLYLYNEKTDMTTTLFEKQMTNIQGINENIYFISNNSLYEYNYKLGLNKILEYDELVFNSDNRIAIYKK